MEERPPSNQKIKLFYALFVERSAGEHVMQIATRHRRGLGMQGRLHKLERLHLTLFGGWVFTGPAPEGWLAFLRQIGDAIRQEPFDITLSRAGSFPRRDDNRPFVMRGDERTFGAITLHKALAGEFIRRWPEPVLPGRFDPHVTMMYDARHVPDRAVEDVCWRANEFALIESWHGQTKYVERGRWTLH